jgi:hypothetical protein
LKKEGWAWSGGEEDMMGVDVGRSISLSFCCSRILKGGGGGGAGRDRVTTVASLKRGVLEAMVVMELIGYCFVGSVESGAGGDVWERCQIQVTVERGGG